MGEGLGHTATHLPKLRSSGVASSARSRLEGVAKGEEMP